MAFIQKKFERATYQARDIFNTYLYETNDGLAELTQDGYFSSCRFFGEQGWVGGTIHALCADGKIQLDITESGAEASEVVDYGLYTGWATYVDTQYTDSVNAFTLPALQDTTLPNNAGSKIESQLPIDVTTFYDGSVITGRNGDNIDVMCYFKAEPTAANQWLDVWIDIGGSVGELYRQTFAFPRGAGTPRGILYALPSGYTLGTWEANGGTIYLRSNDEVNIYGINLNVDRSHKAR